MNTWQQRQDILVETIRKRYDALSVKNKRMVAMIPRIVILMSFSVYFAGLIQHWVDVVMLIISTIILGFILFFIPNNNKKKKKNQI